MMSVKWLRLFYVIPVIIIPCVYAGLRELPISDRSSVSERTMKSILESCYDADSSYETVVVIGNFNEFTDKLPIIRIKNFEHLRPDTLSNFKPTRVIIAINSPYELEAKVGSLIKMSWWDNVASFFIVGKFSHLTSINQRIILFKAVKMNMIHSTLIVPETINSSVLYILNACAHYAPNPWETAEEFERMTLYIQRFDKNVSCRSLNFDKTINLEDHIVKAFMLEDSPNSHLELPAQMFWDVSDAFNIHLWIYYSGSKASAFESLYEGSVDFVTFLSSIEENPTIKFLYPYSDDRIVAVIRSIPKKSIQRKIFHLWNFCAIVLTFTALVVLFSLLLWKNREFSSALLDVMRLIIHSSILIKITSNSFRIFLTTVLIMMIITNQVFQGEMVTSLTARGKNAPIERIETLVQLGYKFYSTPGLEQSIKLHCPKCHAMTVESDECFKYVLENELTACLTEEFIYRHVASMPFDLVKEPLYQTLLVIKCRNDWPLYNRMNLIWMRVFESGLRMFLEAQQTLGSLRERLVQVIERSSTQYEPIKLDQLMFAFKFLAFGSSLSTLVFIGELLMKKYGTPA